jgi:hypothetical protein
LPTHAYIIYTCTRGFTRSQTTNAQQPHAPSLHTLRPPPAPHPSSYQISIGG